MLIEAIIIALIVTLVARGKWENLANLPLHHIWAVVTAAVFEVIVTIIIARQLQPYSALIIDYYLYFQLFVYGFIAFFLYQNRSIPGFKPILVGVLLNLLVITANNGQMPVDASLAIRLGYTAQVQALANGHVAGHTLLIQGQTNLPLLADIFHLAPPYPLPKTISIGDMFLAGGAFWLIIKTTIFQQDPLE